MIFSIQMDQTTMMQLEQKKKINMKFAINYTSCMM